MTYSNTVAYMLLWSEVETLQTKVIKTFDNLPVQLQLERVKTSTCTNYSMIQRKPERRNERFI